ncbi:uncharacterized protein LOC126560365 [Anopheles maculipalpis]|uniref:uncharacterized protein LOC126560365 n=1 Tax=Anopheles maculipalpis TaxID=1496333 RepID=UPI002158F194|nr:uncharacterized protein LOC126560365 [Anopheles maculipalpis]
MASLHPFMLRMNYLHRSTPLSNHRIRRRRSSSFTSSISNSLADPNNNELPESIINPSRKRRKLLACIYKPIGPPEAGEEGDMDVDEQSPQLAVHPFEELPVLLRSEQAIPVSMEQFLSFGRLYCPEDVISSMVYYIPRMVPVSIVSTSYPSYDTVDGSSTIIYRTTIEFRRRYTAVAMQTIETDAPKEEDHEPRFVSHACWNVSECYN